MSENLTMRLLFSEKELPKFKIYAESWLQLKKTREGDGEIWLRGSPYVIDAAISDLSAYSKRHNSKFLISLLTDSDVDAVLSLEKSGSDQK